MSSQLSQWKKIKKSGAFRRRLKICYEKMISGDIKDSFANDKTDQLNSGQQSTNFNNSALDLTNVSSSNILLTETENQRQASDKNALNLALNVSTAVDQLNDQEMIICDDEDEVKNNWLLELECEENTIISEIEKNVDFRKNVRQWAVSFNIPQIALRALFQNINKRFPDILPQDPRTLLKTYKSIVMIKIGNNGSYWHHGFEFCLRQLLTSMHDLPKSISVNISMDGLPIYKSSKCEFWPILFNVYELPEIKPMIIGIYCGKGKPSNLSAFLEPFVEEAKTILLNGLIISGNQVTVKLRCFVCDSPARAFIKGVTNFNSKHGCLKCTTIGEYSHISHTVYFSRAGCEKRTDSGFRMKLYGTHHKQETPLTSLPIDMIEDFPVGDSLHLIDLGVMKRCLVGWRDGSFGTYNTKWCGKDIAYVSSFLENCKLPSEIHRPARGLDVLCYWKASEYHTFLHYLSIVILKDVLPLNIYRHFLNFFCATTICSSKFYVHFLNLAEALFNNYVEYYRDFYGEDYITSNVHNLTHVVDEVRRYGPLSTFNAYPFENRLYQIKNLLRNGNLPLAQVAKRMSEIMQCEMECVSNNNNNTFVSFPVLKKKNDAGLFFKIEFKEFSLSVDNNNKWFLTNNGEIVFMEHAVVINNTAFIIGGTVNDLEEVFEIPIKSSYLNIYKSRCINKKTALTSYSVKNVKCKMVAIKYKDETFFIPLLHSLSM